MENKQELESTGHKHYPVCLIIAGKISKKNINLFLNKRLIHFEDIHGNRFLNQYPKHFF